MGRFLNSFTVELSDASAELYEINPKPEAEGDALFSLLNAHAERLRDEVGGRAHWYRLDGTWFVAVVGARDRRKTVESVNRQDLHRHGEIELDFSRDSDFKLIQRAIFDALESEIGRSDDYWFDNRRYRKRVYAENAEWNLRGFDVYPGVKLRLDAHDGLTLTLDPTLGTHSSKTLADYLADDSWSRGRIEAELDDQFVFERPDRRTVTLVDILEEPVSEVEVEDGKSVLKYARQEYGDRFAERIDDTEPTVLVSFDSGDIYSAAPSLLRYAPTDKRPDEVSQLAAFGPEERWQRTREFLDVVRGFEIGDVDVTVDTDPIGREVSRYGYPTLWFGRDEAVKMAVGMENRTRPGQKITEEYWNPIKSGYLEKFGPRRTFGDLIETALVFPDEEYEAALEAYESIRNYAEEKLGLRLNERPAPFAYDVEEDVAELREVSEPFDITLGFLPEFDEESYYRLIDVLDGHPLQVVTQTGIEDRNGHDEDVVENTAVGLAAKLGVVPFTIEGQLSTQAYLGFNADGGDRGTASAVMLSGETNEIIYRTENQNPTNRSSVTDRSQAKKIVRDALREVVDGDRSDIDEFESLTIHRNGFFGNEEIEGIEETIERLRDTEYLADDFEWAGVEVTHRSPHRLYADEGMPEMGAHARLGDNTVVVVTSDAEQLPQGSPQTLRCHVKAAEGDFDAFQAGRDVFFLSELNWGSPSKGTKDPITVSLTREMNRRLGHNWVSNLRYPPF